MTANLSTINNKMTFLWNNFLPLGETNLLTLGAIGNFCVLRTLSAGVLRFSMLILVLILNVNTWEIMISLLTMLKLVSPYWDILNSAEFGWNSSLQCEICD